MNADGNRGIVIVRGDEAIISNWEISNNTKAWSGINNPEKTLYANQNRFLATLQPLEFDQPYPFGYGLSPYSGKVSFKDVEFSVSYSRYKACIDGIEVPSAYDAPCTVFPKENERLKCIIEFDEEVIFMADRYGHNNYLTLVKKTVSELKNLIYRN